jgi:hypothetical protein
MLEVSQTPSEKAKFMTQPASNQHEQESYSMQGRKIGILKDGDPAPQIISPSTFGLDCGDQRKLFFNTLNDMLAMQAEIMSLTELIEMASAVLEDAECSEDINPLWQEGANELQKAIPYISTINPWDDSIDYIVSDRFYFVVKQFAIVQQGLREKVYGYFHSLVPEKAEVTHEFREEALTHIELSIAKCLSLSETATEQLKRTPDPLWTETDGELWMG